MIPGGTHADGLTSNALIVLRDGAYVELITFNVPEGERTKHRWGAEAPGWIDWAFLGLSAELSDILNARSSAVKYLPTVPGGRERPDGRVLRWRITAPDPQRFAPAALPFFCGDVTPREWRVRVAERSCELVLTALYRCRSTRRAMRGTRMASSALRTFGCSQRQTR